MDPKNSTTCDPGTFYYSVDSVVVSYINSIQRYTTRFTLVLMFTLSPLLILTPFCVRKLRTVNRKIIAMVTLSDCTNLIVGLVMAHKMDIYQDAEGFLLYECTLITMIQNLAPVWSLLW